MRMLYHSMSLIESNQPDLQQDSCALELHEGQSAPPLPDAQQAAGMLDQQPEQDYKSQGMYECTN